MNEVQPPASVERPYRSAEALYLRLIIAGAIGFAGLVAQGVAALLYDPIDLMGAEGCPDDAWPTVASAISLLTVIPVGIFVLAALTRIPLVWAAGPSETVVRATITLVFAVVLAAVLTGATSIWLDALASADCVNEPGFNEFMQSLPWGPDRLA